MVIGEWGVIKGVSLVFRCGNEIIKFKNRQDLENYVENIVNKYELSYVETASEAEESFRLFTAIEKTVFLGVYPDFLEYVEFKKKTPGTIYYHQ